MDEKIRDSLDAEILRRIDNLYKIQIGSEEYESAAKSLKQLCDIAQQDIRDQATYVDQMNKDDLERKRLESEIAQKDAELREQKKNNWIQLGFTGLVTALSFGFHWYWNKRGFLFEEKGTFTSQTLRENKLKVPKIFGK